MKNCKDNNLLCIVCYKELKINGLPDAYFKDKEKLIAEIHERAYGGGHTHMCDCSIAELQWIRQEVMNDDNMNKKVSEVKHHIVTYETISEN